MLNTLNVSQSGLNAAKTAVENVSNNIANENTPGYKKRVVQISELEQMDARFTGRGVNASSSYRITSQYMYDKILTENSRQNHYNELSSILGNVESVFKETEDSGFSSDLNRYFQAVENLRANPNSEVYKTTLKNQGSILVESLQNIYSSIEKLEELEKDELDDNVKSVNRILKEIGLVNEKIGQYTVVSNDLLDKRDQLENELSKFIDIDVRREDGDYELQIAGVTAVRFNTNVRDVIVEDVKTPQIDRFIDSSGTGSGITFTGDGFNTGDTITYKLNNDAEVSVTYGETVLDQNGSPIDLNGDSVIDAADNVDATNYVRALAYKINTNTDTRNLVTASNGNPTDPSNPNQDKFLYIESNVDGTKGTFEGYISVVETTAGTVDERNAFYKDDDQSNDATSRAFVSIFGSEIPLKSGILKAQTDNLTSDSPDNKIQVYKDKLDALAQTLSDLSDKYIKTGTDTYLYGQASVDEHDTGTIEDMGLFSGSSVMTLKFNKGAVTDLKQTDLDYLATLQWKQDLSYTGKAQDSSEVHVNSLSEFFQELKVNVASDKENNDFLLKTQKEVQNSLQNSYDQLVKVDKDEEMVDLIKFQAAYTANAKVITAIDEMLQVLLGLKR